MQEFVGLYILNPDKDKVYLLKKHKPEYKLLHGKLVGFGGKIEEEDKSPYEALKREIKEELDLDLEDFSDVIPRGYIIEGDYTGSGKGSCKVYLYVGHLDYELKEGYIENEGEAHYYPLDHHKTNKDMYIDYDTTFLDALFHTDDILDTDFR